jgi:hypothetical protein
MSQAIMSICTSCLMPCLGDDGVDVCGHSWGQAGVCQGKLFRIPVELEDVCESAWRLGGRTAVVTLLFEEMRRRGLLGR